VFVPKDAFNNLFQDSFARLRQIRSVSVKRLGKSVGTVTDEAVIEAINKQVVEMLGPEA
jgi:mRNA-degrading endonuclease toxin of MazEF toxin-antitoxin module